MTEETKYKDKWCQEAYERGKAEATKELQEEIATLKHNKKTVTYLGDCIEEIQDKKIAELEKQNKDLENKLANVEYQLEGRELEIKELEKQNTNLQIMLKAEREVRCNEDYLKHVTDVEAKIDKAKEIIKKLYGCLLQDDSDEETRHYIIEYMTEAENFLKDE